MEEMPPQQQGLRLLRWTLHRRISMEQAEQKSQLAYCSFDQRQSTSILEIVGRVFKLSSESDQVGCHGTIGVAKRMRLLA